MSGGNFMGVRRHDGGFVANIGHHGKQVYLGMFADFETAKAARIEAEIRLFGAAFDRRGIEMVDDHAMVPLHGRGGVFHGWSVIDADDVDLVSGIAWTLDPRGYVAGRPKGFKTSVTLHRWLALGGEKCGQVVDHIDGDKLNNRRTNLRLCSQGENSRNTRRGQNNTSGAKGVSQDANGRWRARIWKDRKEIRLGTFATVAEARSAYDRAAAELHGEFASPNEAPTARAAVEVREL